MTSNLAYDKMYLEDVMKVHAFLFSKLNELKEYSVCSMIDVYMQHSEIRAKMDVGNWSALNKGYKQLLNSVDFTLCAPRNDKEDFDDIILGWVSDIYVLLQWKKNIPSAEINRRVPAKEMTRIYYPLHEASLDVACEKIYRRYF